MTADRQVALAGAVVLALLALWRRRQGRTRRAALGAAGAGALAFYAMGANDAFEHIQDAVERSGDALGAWTYPVVAGMAFLETGVPPLSLLFPGEFTVIFGGLMASEGSVSLVPLVAIVWVASALGDSVSFLLGRRYGRPWLLEHGRRVGMTQARLERLDRFFDRFGSASVAVGRFVPVARPCAPFLAGASRLAYPRFLAWNALGTLLFAIAFTLVGYAFYETAVGAAQTASDATLGIVALTIVAVLVFSVVRSRRRAAKAALPLAD